MTLLKIARLSVQPVSEKHFKLIEQLAKKSLSLSKGDINLKV
jgi:hypothetical protein